MNLRTPILTAALGLIMSVLSAPAAPLPTYSVTDIGFLLGITKMHPAAINIYGDVVGTAVIQPSVGFGAAFLYTNGQLISIDFAPTFPGIISQAIGINDQKEVVGWELDYGDPDAWIYQNGELHLYFDVMPPGYTIPTAINDIGQITGSYYDYNTEASGYFLFTPNSPLIQLSFRPTAINNLGQMAGDGVVITQPGGTTPQYLGNLGGPAYATGINNKGQVVGYSATTNQSNAAVYGVLYSQGKIVNLGLPKGETAPQYESFATAINDHGQIVGYSSGGSPLVPSHGLLYLNNHWHDLNDLVNATVNGLTIVEANGINDLGQIVATATDAAGNEHAVILTVVGSKPAFVP